MSDPHSNPQRLLIEAAEKYRREFGLPEVSPDLGGGGGGGDVDSRLRDIADRVAATQDGPPVFPETRTLQVMLIVIFIAAVVFVVTLVIAHDKPYVTTLLVGEGTIFTALTGIAAYMATTHDTAVKAYCRRAEQWQRMDAVVRIMKEMSRGLPNDPMVMIKVLEASSAAVQPSA